MAVEFESGLGTATEETEYQRACPCAPARLGVTSWLPCRKLIAFPKRADPRPRLANIPTALLIEFAKHFSPSAIAWNSPYGAHESSAILLGLEHPTQVWSPARLVEYMTQPVRGVLAFSIL